MKVFLVGGAVRDRLLGLPVKERDYVVVGASADEMRQQGFLPVGKDFPVFLHPHTKEEYALARTERKTGPGYQGFCFHAAPDVSLEADLMRRDLTINAMAESETGELIDPYGGRADLEAKLLRHVSPAFVEDPVRVLRLARFAARYAHLGFRMAPETAELMRTMVASGEVNALVPERVWMELSKALMEQNPQVFFQVLAEVQALPVIFPGVSQLLERDPTVLEKLTHTASEKMPLEIRFAVLLMHAVSLVRDKKAWASLQRDMRAPSECVELARLAAMVDEESTTQTVFSAAAVLHVLERMDAIRRPERFLDVLTVLRFDHGEKKLPLTAWLASAQAVILPIKIDAATQQLSGPEIALKLRELRLQAIMSAIHGRA